MLEIDLQRNIPSLFGKIKIIPSKGLYKSEMLLKNTSGIPVTSPSHPLTLQLAGAINKFFNGSLYPTTHNASINTQTGEIVIKEAFLIGEFQIIPHLMNIKNKACFEIFETSLINLLQTMNYFPPLFIEKTVNQNLKENSPRNLEERFEDRCARYLAYSNFYIWDLQKSSGSFNSFFEQEKVRRKKKYSSINNLHYFEAMALPLFGSTKKFKTT